MCSKCVKKCNCKCLKYNLIEDVFCEKCMHSLSPRFASGDESV